jgi:8-oxo-dGTP pyrophosphatase MutT (NUDIX family)/uncharacterized protein YqgV (UPF0045/DUF77 family)
VPVVVTTSDGRLVVQRRAESKDLFPGWWDIGAGGVVGAGESRTDAAVRELDEELGITADLTFIGVGRHDDEHAREICHIYAAVHDGPFEARDGEAAEIRTVDHDQFAALTSREPILPGSAALLLPHVPGFRAARSWQLEAGRCVPCTAVQRVEFTIEPFVEAQPGPHVTEPVEALRALGVEVDIGPFGSGCEVSTDNVANVVATVVRVAIEHGATHVNIDVNAVTPT